MMKKLSADDKKLLKKLNDQLKKLQEELAVANKAAGIDEHISVKVRENQARFERVKIKNKPDKGVGKFFIEVEITAKKETVYLPISIASGKTVTGFMYQIEGTAKSTISTASVKPRGEGITQVTLGTLLFSKIPAGKTASFRIQSEIGGKVGKTYKVIISRINYKTDLTDSRYQKYLKPIISDSVKFS